jgi:hypothetical protein
MTLPFYAPKLWWEKREKAIKEECNGCGSELDLSGRLVPDTIYGLNIRDICCCPHDWMYKHGITWIDKIFADVMFLYNMIALIINTGGWLTIPRILRATKYFVAVVAKGNDSFAHEKTVSEEKIITFKGEFR